MLGLWCVPRRNLSTHGGAEDLMYMRLHELEGTMLEDRMKLRMTHTICKDVKFVGSRCLYFSMK